MSNTTETRGDNDTCGICVAGSVPPDDRGEPVAISHPPEKSQEPPSYVCDSCADFSRNDDRYTVNKL